MPQDVTRPDAVIGVITNPHSRKNRGQAARAAALQAILGGRGLVRETRSTEEIGPILDEFRARGVSYWVTDGGDGSLHWLVNSAAARFGLAEVPTALPWTIPANGGTIDFVARHAGVRGRAESILRRLLSEHDAGRPLPVTEVPTVLVRGVQQDDAGAERPFERIGFAAAVAGVGSGFFDQYYATSRQGSPAILEVIARTAGAVVLDAGPWRRLVPAGWLRYGHTALARVRARLTVDGRDLPYEELTVFNVGAFPINLGGVIKCFQGAGQGLLHVTAGDISAFGIMGNLPRLFTGRALRSRRLFDGPAREVHAVATGATLLRPVLDGELIPRVRSLTISAGPTFRVPRLDARRA
jgi:diacylglycerol kinase family enzyme